MPQPRPFSREWNEAIDDPCGDGNPACDDEEDLIDAALLDKIRPKGVRLRKFEEEL